MAKVRGCLHFIRLQDAVLFIKDFFPGDIHDVFNMENREKLKNKIKIMHTHPPTPSPTQSYALTHTELCLAL